MTQPRRSLGLMRRGAGSNDLADPIQPASPDAVKPALPPCQTWSVTEAAAILGVSDDNLYDRLKEDGTVAGIRAIKLGSSWRIPKAPLEALVTGQPT